MIDDEAERMKIGAWMLSQGAPRAFVRHFIKTGAMDGSLWPLTVPVHWSDIPSPAGERDMTG